MLQVSYEPLWETLSARDMKKVDLKTIITPTALKKLQNHEPVSLNVLKLQRSFQPEAVRGAGRAGGEARGVQANGIVYHTLIGLTYHEGLHD